MAKINSIPRFLFWPVRQSSRNERRTRLRPERLEDRTVPTVITGTITDFGETNHLTIAPFNGPDQAIDPSATTWLVVHGRNSSPADFGSLARAVAAARPGDQVLTLDWSEAARSPLLDPARGERFIVPVASWAAAALANDGFAGTRLNLVGHSWGAYVSDELAERIPFSSGPATGVNGIVALDPAANVPIIAPQYNPEAPGQIDFAAHSQFSWAFHAAEATSGILLGSILTPATADESFVLTGVDHNTVIDAFQDLIERPTAISTRFPLSNVVHHDPYPFWIKNEFGPFGGWTSPLSGLRSFEAVLGTEPDPTGHLRKWVDSVMFFNNATPSATDPVSRIAVEGLAVESITAGDPPASSGPVGSVTVTVASTVANFGNTLSAASSGVFYASRDPGRYGAEFNLGQRSIPALAPLYRSTNTSTLSLAGLPAEALVTGVLYVAIAIDPTTTPNAGDLEWVKVPINSSTGAGQPPVIGSVNGPRSVKQTKRLTLTAANATDDGAVTQVNFYLDSNGNGTLDAGDALLGSGSRAGSDWTLTVATTGWALGDARVFVKAIDDGGLTRVDDFNLTVVALPRDLLATGTDTGGLPVVNLYDVATGQGFSFFAYASSFLGGVRVATADVTGDGVEDLITGPGPGGGPHVKVFDGVTHAEVRSFFAFAPGFTGGVWVAAGDWNNDGRADIIVGADAGGGPHVKVFSGLDQSELASFFAYGPSFTGGVRVASADVNGDGIADVITGAGPGGGPHVRAFSGMTGVELASFFAYAPAFSGGIFVAGADSDGDGIDDFITGAGAGGGPHVKVFSGATHLPLQSFFATGPSFTGGVRVAADDRDGDGMADLVTSLGSPGEPHVKTFKGNSLALLDDVQAYDPSFLGGVFVG